MKKLLINFYFMEEEKIVTMDNGVELTSEEIKAKEDAERAIIDSKCEAIAEEIIQIIAQCRPSAKKLNHEQMIANYAPIQKQVTQLMLDKDVSLRQTNYIWSILQSIIDQSKELTISSIQVGFEKAERKLFDVVDMSDLTLNKIDSILKMD